MTPEQQDAERQDIILQNRIFNSPDEIDRRCAVLLVEHNKIIGEITPEQQQKNHNEIMAIGLRALKQLEAEGKQCRTCHEVYLWPENEKNFLCPDCVGRAQRQNQRYEIDKNRVEAEQKRVDIFD